MPRLATTDSRNSAMKSKDRLPFSQAILHSGRYLGGSGRPAGLPRSIYAEMAAIICMPAAAAAAAAAAVAAVAACTTMRTAITIAISTTDFRRCCHSSIISATVWQRTTKGEHRGPSCSVVRYLKQQGTHVLQFSG